MEDHNDILGVKPSWQNYINEGVRSLLSQATMVNHIDLEHLANTPARVVRAWEEAFSGVSKNPVLELGTVFPTNGIATSQIITVAHVEFVSYCAHHLVPFIGRYSFGYLPGKYIVGLSKIPRMMEVLCARPQVQEVLAQQAIEAFSKVLEPHGCGIVIDAFHCCMCCRGVKKWATTRTVTLQGVFLENHVKMEFLHSVGPISQLGL